MVNARPRALSATYLTSTLPTLLPPIFEQAQHTTANHRKNIVALRKIQDTCSTITETSAKSVKLVGEKAFNALFVEMVNRVLPIKKGVAVADRVVKFVAQYVAYTTEQDAAERPEGEEEVETASSRFIVKLLRHLLSGMQAKDKNVRFRVTLLTVSMINGLGEMDDDLYVLLRECLLERARDKESAVRVQAALGLAKLQSGEDEDDLEEGQESLAEVLLDMLRYDPAAEVRRAALYNLPRTPSTLPFILSRTRDVDPILRKTVYHGSLSSASLPDSRVLSIAQREEVVRNGLGDREPSVRKAAAGMLGDWVDSAEGDLLDFLDRFDVVSSQVVEDALVSVFVTRPEVFDAVEFDDNFWTSLTPEKAFLARIYVDHCISTKNEARLEDVLPVVTALAFTIQNEYNMLVVSTNEENEDMEERAFIVGELLRLAINLDYADEIGRRKMFQLAREMISQSSLPEVLIPRCIDVLSKISNGERDLIRVVVDVVTELREGEGDVESELPIDSQASSIGESPRRPGGLGSGPRFDPNDPEARMKAALIDLRCLMICISLLERVNSNLQDNSVFHGLLPDLIIPAVTNKEEPALRDQGLICLGLCCMIDAKMAVNSFGLFIQQLQVADDELKLKVIQVVFDLLMVHDIDTLVSKTMSADKVVDLVRHTLNQDTPQVQAAACEGIAKLMLAGMIDDESILQALVLLYFSPETADNQPLRQCLTYFLPIYCYTSPVNQRHMLSIFMDTFNLLSQIAEDLEDDQEMPPLGQMGLMMIDWTDPQKAVERDGLRSDPSVHLDLAIEILKSILTDTTRETRKTLVSFLSKLNLPEAEESEEWKMKSLILLTNSIKSRRPLADASSRNALTRFEGSVTKKWSAQLDGYDEDTFRGDGREEVSELFGFIDDVNPADPEAMSEAGSSRPKGRSMNNRNRISASRDVTPEDESVAGTSDGDRDDEETPKRTSGGRQVSGGNEKKMQIVEEEEEEEEDEDEDVESILDD